MCSIRRSPSATSDGAQAHPSARDCAGPASGCARRVERRRAAAHHAGHALLPGASRRRRARRRPARRAPRAGGRGEDRLACERLRCVAAGRAGPERDAGAGLERARASHGRAVPAVESGSASPTGARLQRERCGAPARLPLFPQRGRVPRGTPRAPAGARHPAHRPRPLPQRAVARAAPGRQPRARRFGPRRRRPGGVRERDRTPVLQRLRALSPSRGLGAERRRHAAFPPRHGRGAARSSHEARRCAGQAAAALPRPIRGEERAPGAARAGAAPSPRALAVRGLGTTRSGELAAGERSRRAQSRHRGAERALPGGGSARPAERRRGISALGAGGHGVRHAGARRRGHRRRLPGSGRRAAERARRRRYGRTMGCASPGAARRAGEARVAAAARRRLRPRALVLGALRGDLCAAPARVRGPEVMRWFVLPGVLAGLACLSFILLYAGEPSRVYIFDYLLRKQDLPGAALVIFIAIAAAFAPLARAGLTPVEAIGRRPWSTALVTFRSEEHTSELQSLAYLVCRLLLEKKKKYKSKGGAEWPTGIKTTWTDGRPQ